MCDCYSMICKCRKFYVPVHITDFAYPRDIVKQAYCPFCNYRGPETIEKEYETNQDSEFAVDNYLFHCGASKGYEGKCKLRVSGKRVNGFFSLVFDKKHKDYKPAQKFMQENVGFNGNPNDVENLVPDCYHYRCKRIEKKKEWDKFLKRYFTVDYCKKYKKEIWRIRQSLKHDCKFLK